ncbi:citrate lyase subunit gamma (acyl carrier protein) [Lachnotalea glycerini]|uniref:Citrate lyase acyl carrier protein n=1 Tax=Lachnotalea glycerini TaxID=1763509 RepID=A0A255IRE5_9FIRM|nr:citrate lyase acyl carrier protein [Lachnotalea glycerini]PXV95830.1 citrate lyase subunit gamma (acyl carrier protein) [Lachnotalea glycerini]RDY33109.1 citrate lyase acyl carrier protein [Lachnotalea glycerini]
MKVVKTGVAGTMESSDIMITVCKSDKNGIDIKLESSVEKQFGKQIKAVIEASANRLQLKDAKIIAIDKGALDCVIKARVETAIYRACESTDYRWGEQ